MKKRFSKKLSVFVFLALVSILGSMICFSQAYAGPKITMTGTILSPNDKGNVHTYVLWTQAQKWHFKVTRVEAIDTAGTSSYGFALLEEISPPQINIVGNKKLIQDFAKSAAPGKHFQLEGILYVADGVLFLSSAKEVKK